MKDKTVKWRGVNLGHGDVLELPAYCDRASARAVNNYKRHKGFFNWEEIEFVRHKIRSFTYCYIVNEYKDLLVATVVLPRHILKHTKKNSRIISELKTEYKRHSEIVKDIHSQLKHV